MTPASDNKDIYSNRILLVEDDHDLREQLYGRLTILGYDVTVLSSAIELYSLIGLSQYCIAIIDLLVSDENGLVLIKYIKRNSNALVVVFSEYGTYEEKLLSYFLGADYYMVKPIDIRELSIVVRNQMSRMVPDSGSACVDENILIEENTNPTTQTPAKLKVANSVENHSWKLVHNGWQLVEPQGGIIQLTLKEYRFLLCLAQANDLAVARKDILRSLEYRDDEYGRRALEALVYRLRKKTKGVGYSPIQTAHGVGYSLNQKVVLI